MASPKGCHCLSWNRSPFDPPQLVIGTGQGASVWQYHDQSRRWTQALTLTSSSTPIYDVDWAPQLGRSYHLIACGSPDHHVRIYRVQIQDEEAKGTLQATCLADLDLQQAEVWRVAWNATGTVLATTGGNGSVCWWRRDLEGHWQCSVQVPAGGSDTLDVDDRHEPSSTPLLRSS